VLVIVSDRSVLIDVAKARLIESALALPYEFVVPDVMLADELVVEPDLAGFSAGNRVDVRGQSGVQLEEIPLIAEDAEALEALRILQEKGYTSDEVKQASRSWNRFR